MEPIVSYIVSKLMKGKKSNGGRNNSGRITVRHQGGGSKRLYRPIDFTRHFGKSLSGIVLDILYDPNRNSHIALVCYSNKLCSFILAGEGLNIGDTVYSNSASKHNSSSSSLSSYEKNDLIHCIELHPGAGGKVCRSAGSYALKLGDYGHKVLLKLPSGELRLFDGTCLGSYGMVSNRIFSSIKKLKAGDSRRLGVRPSVRGVAMNPVDHPHGGGEGRTSGGRPSVTKWCKVAKGKGTRKKLSYQVVKTRDGKISLIGDKLKKYVVKV